MKNSDVYERIAQAYFGTVPQKKEVRQPKSFNAGLLVKAGLAVLIVLAAVGAFSGFYYYRNSSAAQIDPTRESIAIMHTAYPIRLKYNFNWPYPDIKRLSFDLPKVNLSKFQSIEVTLRGSRFKGDLTRNMRVEVENRYNEKDAQYVHIPNNYWNSYDLDLSAFKGISDWSGVTKLSFVVEKWNVGDNEGAVYINDIKFAKAYRKLSEAAAYGKK